MLTNYVNFISSPLAKKIIDDLKESTGVEITMIDNSGNILVSPDFLASMPKQDHDAFLDFLADTAAKLELRQVSKRVELKKPDGMSFYFSPVPDNENSTIPGFIVAGPYLRNTRKRQAHAKYEVDWLCEKLEDTPALSPAFEKITRKFVGSQAFLLGNLFVEKYRSKSTIKRLSGLSQVSGSIIGSLDREYVLQNVLYRAIALLGASKGSIMMLDESGKKLRMIAARGLPEDLVKKAEIRVGDSIAGKVAREGKPRLLFKGVRDEASTIERNPGQYDAAMSVPLKTRDNVIGVLNISGKIEEGNFTTADLELLTALAANAASVIENARLYEKLERKIEELESLIDLGKTMVSTLRQEEVLEKVLYNAIRLLEAHDGSLMLVDPDEEVLKIAVAHGLPEDIVENTEVQIGEGMAGKVALEGKPRLLKKGKKAEDSKSAADGDETMPSALSVPLTFHDNVIGVLNVKGKINEENFTKSDLKLLSMLGDQAAIAIENSKLHKSLQDLFVNSIRALANAIEARDVYTRGHSERVTEYSVKIAQKLGFEKDEVEKIRYAALLHDVGKINIREDILNKPGRLTEEEMQVMWRHPSMGAMIMEPVKEFREILPYMLHHHERYGKGGYPNNLQGEQIPLAARILSVADSFDAMTSDRPYRKALEFDKAITELVKNAGGQFDPKVVETFLDICKDESEWVDNLIESSKVNTGESESLVENENTDMQEADAGESSEAKAADEVSEEESVEVSGDKLEEDVEKEHVEAGEVKPAEVKEEEPETETGQEQVYEPEVESLDKKDGDTDDSIEKSESESESKSKSKSNKKSKSRNRRKKGKRKK